MNLKSVFIYGFLALVLTTTACIKQSNDDPGSGGVIGGGNLDCNTVTNKRFSADVNPIIQTTCNRAGCHATGSTNGPGALTNYSEIYSARERIRYVMSVGNMPPGGSLSYTQRSYIICWIDSGAPNN